MFSSVPTVACEACPAGKFTAAPQQSSCKLCGEGTWSDDLTLEHFQSCSTSKVSFASDLMNDFNSCRGPKCKEAANGAVDA
jgi:hypothetical protein